MLPQFPQTSGVYAVYDNSGTLHYLGISRRASARKVAPAMLLVGRCMALPLLRRPRAMPARLLPMEGPPAARCWFLCIQLHYEIDVYHPCCGADCSQPGYPRRGAASRPGALREGQDDWGQLRSTRRGRESMHSSSSISTERAADTCWPAC